MAIAYVGGQVAGRSNPSSALSVNYALTGGLASVPAAGDLVIVTCVTGSAGGNPAMAVTTPATWTALGQLNQSAVSADTSLNVSYKFMGGTPDTAVTIPGTADNTFGEAYAIQVWRGVDPTTPLDGVAPASAGGTGTGRPDPAAITPATAGAVVVICGGGATGTGANYTAPANYTTNFLTASGADTTDAMVGMGYWTGWTSGAENPGAYTGGTTGAVDSWCSYTLALRPVAAPNHATTGALTGQGSTVAGSAAHVAKHATSGALTGQGSTTAGSATRFRAHPASGALTGQGATVAGSAARTRQHPTSGVLAGQGSEVVGSADRQDAPAFVTHATSGALTGQGAAAVGSAARERLHPTTGALTGQGAVIAGSAARMRSHATSGTLSGPGAVVAGSAARVGPAVTHDTSGDLVGAGASLSGSARAGVAAGKLYKSRPYHIEVDGERQYFTDPEAALEALRELREQEKPKPKKLRKRWQLVRTPRETVLVSSPVTQPAIRQADLEAFDWLRQRAQPSVAQLIAQIARRQAEDDEDDIELLLLAV